MSLRGFHLIFVVATVSLAVFFGFWAYNEYTIEHRIGYLLTTTASFCAAIGFIIYGITFSKKIK
ncbi:MAG: hypothetical protein KBD53_00180 [Candidatus Omnitrophica bacterium]|nr:hypothetical protein [Candidatus Omnitrophota bacterium]